MKTIVGRDTELVVALEAVRSSAKGRTARALRIAGRSGVGKTAFLRALTEAAESEGWLNVWVACHRIQVGLPLSVVRRLIDELVKRLGDEAAHYTSGLQIDNADASMLEDRLMRILEGVTLDHHVMLAVDDAQWCDHESRAIISRTLTALGQRAAVLLSTERYEEADEPVFEFKDAAISLGSLREHASAELARLHYPEASDDVITAIVAHAAGHALDVVTLTKSAREQSASTAQHVAASMRRIVASDVALLPAELRKFLQICSLISDPIEFSILQQLWNDNELFEYIERLSSRYLVQEGTSLRFVHAAIAESVRETVAIEVPFRRRIISAIQKLPLLRLEDYERLAEQALAAGDRTLARNTLMQLGDEASKVYALGLAARAWERAADLSAPKSEEIVPFYSRLAFLYNVTGRVIDSIRACRAGLHAAYENGIDSGVGVLVASMVLALWHTGDGTEAEAAFERYDDIFKHPADCAQLFSTGMFLAMARLDGARMRAYSEKLEQLDDVSPAVQVRQHSMLALFHSRSGSFLEAMGSINAALKIAAMLPPLARTMPEIALALTTFMHRGVAQAAPLLDPLRDERGLDVKDYLRVVSMLARGEIADVHSAVLETLVHHNDAFTRRNLLSVSATAAHLGGQPLPPTLQQLIDAEIESFVAGDRGVALLPLASAWLIQLGEEQPVRARLFLTQLLDRMAKPLDPTVVSFPITLSIVANALGDSDALGRIGSERGVWHDQHPWNIAHHELARGAALTFVGDTRGKSLLASARDHFERLGAPYFAALAGRVGTTAARPQVAKSDALGNTTRREREVAALVAEGLTNREIAEKLVLSERTIEGHIANLFSKVNVGSRTQLAAWYLRSSSSVA